MIKASLVSPEGLQLLWDILRASRVKANVDAK